MGTIIDSETGEIISDIMERPDPVRLHQTGLEVAGPLSYGDWSNFGRTLQRVEGAIHWWLGDWYRYGEATYGEIAAQAVDELGFSYETVKADVWVACKVESVRRRTGLSWSHHKEVAALEPEQQDYWLARAEAEGMSREELRYAIRLARMKEGRKGSTKVVAESATTLVGDLPPRKTDSCDGPFWVGGLMSRRARKRRGRKGSTKGVAESATPLVGDLPPHKTDSELAKLADTSERGIRQSAYIAENASEPIKEAAREGHMSRDRAYRLARALAPLPAEDRAQTGARPQSVRRRASWASSNWRCLTAGARRGRFSYVEGTCRQQSPATRPFRALVALPSTSMVTGTKGARCVLRHRHEECTE
jgi:hypothetical protein